MEFEDGGRSSAFLKGGERRGILGEKHNTTRSTPPLKREERVSSIVEKSPYRSLTGFERYRLFTSLMPDAESLVRQSLTLNSQRVASFG